MAKDAKKSGGGRRVLLGAGAILLGLLVLVRTIGLWESRGGLLAFLEGQFAPDVQNIPFDATVAQPPEETVEVTARIRTNAPVHRVHERYLSYAIDLSQATGGKWWDPEAAGVETGSGEVEAPVFDFTRPQLNRYVAELRPAFLRIGGSESDKIYYDLNEAATSADNTPEGYESVLTRGQWNALADFARRHELQIIFTLNAGPSARNADGSWNPQNARELIAHAAKRNDPVAYWELGNEVNNFWYVFGSEAHVSAERYRRDSETLHAMIQELDPDAAFAGQGGMIWPVFGQPLALFFGMSFDAIRLNGDLQKVVSWHYYPQQGRRGPIASRRAYPGRLLNPENLNEAAYWGSRFREARNEHAPDAELWLGESGNAQFGGEPGLSDVYLGGLWWLDQLGLLAREKHHVVIRQSLTGMNYGLLSETALNPRPDYWNSILWKRLMGRDVFAVALEGAQRGKVRVYAHGDQNGALTVLAINLHHDRAARIELPDRACPCELYRMTAPDIFRPELQINGALAPSRAEDGYVDPLSLLVPLFAEDAATIELPPLGYAFLRISAAKQAAGRAAAAR